MHMQIEFICQCSNITLANICIQKGRKDSQLPGGVHTWTMVAEIIDDRPVRDRVDSPLGRHSGKDGKKL